MQSVKEYLQFSEAVTRFGEAGAYGFLEHLNSRDAAQIVLQSITIEARQEMILRQFEGIFPMPVGQMPRPHYVLCIYPAI